jgi:hypothetical protein
VVDTQQLEAGHASVTLGPTDMQVCQCVCVCVCVRGGGNILAVVLRGSEFDSAVIVRRGLTCVAMW